MKAFPIGKFPKALAAALCGLFPFLILSACDRLAGTEVGNPEITVAARFAIHDTDASASIAGMSLKVMGMGCWNEPDGHMVDFAADAAAPLPPVSVKAGAWSRAEMTLQAPGEALTLPDSQGFAEWSNPRYIKLVKTVGPDTLRALFRLSSGMRIRLGFTPASIQKWRKDGGLMVTILFDAGNWAAGLGADPSFVYRLDGKRSRYLLLAPDENSGAYQILNALLPQSFMADSADMR
jgi:hypothetical protein